MLPIIEELPIVNVAAGIVTNDKGLFLVALRHPHVELGGLWEFPGGKVELDERIEDALARELTEEIGIVVIHARLFLKIEHAYPHKKILLHVYRVSHFQGEPKAMEGQELRWVTLKQLSLLHFPAANMAIIEALNTVEA